MYRQIRLHRLALAVPLLILVAGGQSVAEQKEFSNWPAGQSPREIGKRVAERFLASPHFVTPTHQYITYPEVCLWYGSLTFAQFTKDNDLTSRLIKRFAPLLTPVEAGLLPSQGEHVDQSVFGALPLELYIQTKVPKYLELGKAYADKQWENPTPDGLTKETRFWIDDMYMITLVQLQAYRATGDARYLDRAALEMSAYLDKLQQPNGLFYHAPDVPFYWGRGNGWVASGLTELLRSLPKNHPKRARILEGYRKMMSSLLEFQGKDGLWRQLVDRPEAWPETSCTGMFTFAMITGVKAGWLGKQYAAAARKGWLGLVSYIEPDGDIRNVCEGTGKQNDYQYYMDRARRTGDMHGQAPIMWCVTALLR